MTKENRRETGNTIKLKKGYKVRVISGKDKGREGEVIHVFPNRDRVVVSGINMVKSFRKKTQKDEGGIIEMEAPLRVSKVALICPKCKEAVRVGKSGICKNCGKKI